MTIVVDGRAFVVTSAGISNFAKGAIISWANQCSEDSFIIVLPREVDKTFSIEDFPHNVVFRVQTNWLLCRLPNVVWLLFNVSRLVRRYNASIYFSPTPSIPIGMPKSVLKIVTVCDVVNIEYKETMQLSNVLANKVLFNRGVMKADIVWTISEYTKERVNFYFPKRKCRDIFVGCSTDSSLYRRLELSTVQRSNLRNKYGIKGDYILFVGSLEPRKNLSFLLKMAPDIYEQFGVQVVIVGAKGWKNSDLKLIVEDESFNKESVVFCGYVPNDDLVLLYNAAQCFVSTSLNEGFGLPQLEALLCGCPVVTANNSAMTEVASGKDGAFLVDGYNPKVWIDTIGHVLNVKPQVNYMQIAQYDWRKIAERLAKRIQQEQDKV